MMIQVSLWMQRPVFPNYSSSTDSVSVKVMTSGTIAYLGPYGLVKLVYDDGDVL